MATLKLKKGESFRIEALSNPGYVFSHWDKTSASGVGRINENPAVLTGEEDAEFTAFFLPEDEYIIPDEMTKITFWYARDNHFGDNRYTYHKQGFDNEFRENIASVTFVTSPTFEGRPNEEYTLTIDREYGGAFLNGQPGHEVINRVKPTFKEIRFNYRNGQSESITDGIMDGYAE